MKPATVSRRAARALVLESVRNLPAEEFGECAVCSLTHNHPGVTAVCPECGRELCLGLGWVCECGEVVSGASGRLRDATEKAGGARESVPARGDIFTPSTRRS